MREKRREATIERIVETALRLLETEGFEALTIQRLAKELNYAVGALYRYFRSKDALLVALLHRIMDRIGEDLQAAQDWLQERDAAASADDPADERAMRRLLAICHVYIGFAQRRPAEYGLISTLIGDPREFLATEAAAPIVPALIRLQLTLTELINGAAKAGALDEGNGRERGVILWAGMQGVLQLRKLGRFGVAGVELDRLAPIALRTILLGWGAKASQIDLLTPEVEALAVELSERRNKLDEARAQSQDRSADPGDERPTPSP
ncbi:TetR family transcriptional regulator [Pseudenhygromyxa sp. WMMC2535]|uniref:TetR/AcrR family transcriptional regulator n=1 Tax=Pseudenhygromyxa sp. WMMC2535 TaxID=2712867 RepID=UPI001555EA3D|nr:TetR family transcriptional regulator [Pseudenhygromyxa sp. WMMC2535]NVB36585.1 TetR family transcriptional regulator [Pseudenhygromyxa sp. WMMC2535]